MAKKKKGGSSSSGGGGKGGKKSSKNDNTPPSTSLHQPKQRKNNNKRGDKKKNYKNNNNDDEDNDTQFRQQLQTQSLTIRTMSSDGNCLFRSISDQLYGDSGISHSTIRSEICNHISNNTDEYQHFLLMDEDDEDIMDITSYVDEMREEKTWGSDVEIVAACRVYNVGIKVFSCVHDGGVLRFGDHTDDGTGSGGEEDLLLSYHGNDHYNSVHPMDGSNGVRQKERLKQRQKKQQEMMNEGRYSTRTSRKNSKKKNSNGDGSEEGEEDGEDESELSTTSREAINVQPSATSSCTNGTTDDNIDTTSNTDTANTKKKKRTTIKTPPKKSSPCPCGSGLKYKKCCFAREKSKKRLARMNHNGDDDNDDKEKEVSDGEEEKKEEFIGDFKVLNI